MAEGKAAATRHRPRVGSPRSEAVACDGEGQRPLRTTGGREAPAPDTPLRAAGKSGGPRSGLSARLSGRPASGPPARRPRYLHFPIMSALQGSRTCGIESSTRIMRRPSPFTTSCTCWSCTMSRVSGSIMMVPRGLS